VPFLRSADTAIVTAASAERTSFGCQADNDWTFFGDALINHALRKPQPLADAAAEATRAIAGWESSYGLQSSQPQVMIGDGVSRWLPALEARGPRTPTAPVGTPATASMPQPARR
jgi:hypothetical protein